MTKILMPQSYYKQNAGQNFYGPIPQSEKRFSNLYIIYADRLRIIPLTLM